MSLENEISKILCENSDTQIFFADNSEDIGNFTDSVIKKNTDDISEFIDQLMNTNKSEGEKSGETSEGNEGYENNESNEELDSEGNEENEGSEEELITESLTEETSNNMNDIFNRGILLFSLISSIIITIIVIKSIRRPKVYQYNYDSTGDYDNYDHNSGEAWDFEDAKMYRDTKQKFGKTAFENDEQDYTYRDQSSYNQNSYNQNNNQSASSNTNMFDAMFKGLSPEKAREVYISLTKSFHSDNGGDDSKMGELNAAYDNYKKYNK